MPQYPYIFYNNPFVDTIQVVDTAQVADTSSCENLVPSFITSGFGGEIVPMPRMNYELLQGWDLAILGLMLLLIVLNKQLYPRQFRQILVIPGGLTHTNQLLREWNPMGSFLCVSFTVGYIILMSLFVQKSCVVLSRDIMQYNNFHVFGVFCAAVAGWVLLRYLTLHFVNWLFETKDVVDRQMTVQFSLSIIAMLVMIPLLLLLLYNPTSLFVWIGIVVLGVMAVLRFIIEIIETRVFTKIPVFYIFLYLCALEIVPLVTVVTAALRYFSHGTVF